MPMREDLFQAEMAGPYYPYHAQPLVGAHPREHGLGSCTVVDPKDGVTTGSPSSTTAKPETAARWRLSTSFWSHIFAAVLLKRLARGEASTSAHSWAPLLGSCETEQRYSLTPMAKRGRYGRCKELLARQWCALKSFEEKAAFEPDWKHRSNRNMGIWGKLFLRGRSQERG
ncbi:coiled-coil domain containing 171 [Phyllostomus discolor]|uniref:Coiled-coil domain containing 171 n=1 Tax=Phyllostomus discolor TaxID=89673 RepID=A0A834B3H0_9CHIR|nr:coiled-coil domain containing 171 [Phyllostomus discolor]